MHRWSPIVAIGLLLTTSTGTAQDIDWNDRAPWSSLRPETEETGVFSAKEPFQVFDNLYYVGLDTVSAYLLTTDEGLVLINATYAETADAVIDSVRQLGFDPTDITYVFVTHADADVYGGAARIRELTGARIGMSAADWDVLVHQEGGDTVTRDLVVADREVIVVGNTALKFYLTPGHTPGALSLEYLVYDDRRPYRALTPGGLDLDVDAAWTDAYIDSLEWLQTLGRWDVLLPNHPFMVPGHLFDRAKDLDSSRDGRHPVAIGPAAVHGWLDGILEVAREKAALELSQAETRRP